MFPGTFFSPSGEQVLIRSASQHPLLESLRIDLQKIDQVLIESHRDVVVVLNLAFMSQTNLIDEPPQVGKAAEESLGTPWILHHVIFLQTIILFASGLAPRDPITRLAFQMHDGCYINHFPFDSIDDAIGKPLKEITPEPPFQYAPHGGMLLNLFEGCINRIQELFSESLAAIFIKQSGLADFLLRGGIETNVQ
jgi:hypothetical protein